MGMPTACFPGQKPDPNQPDLGDIFPSLVTTADMILNWCPSDGSLLLNCVRAIQVCPTEACDMFLSVY